MLVPAGAAAAAADAPSASATPTAGAGHVIITRQRDRLVGNVVSIDSGGRVHLAGPQFADEVVLAAGAVDAVLLKSTDAPSGPNEILLTSGDRLVGTLVAITTAGVDLDTEAAGRLHVAMQSVREIGLNKPASPPAAVVPAEGGGRLQPDAPVPAATSTEGDATADASIRVLLVNKDRVTATTVSLADGQVVLTTAYGQVKCPVKSVERIVLSAKAPVEPPRRDGDVRVHTTVGRLTLRLGCLTPEVLVGQSDDVGEVRLKRSAVGEIRFGQDWASLTGTTWSGPADYGNGTKIMRFDFKPNGGLVYSYNGSTYANGSWTQDGEEVTIEMNNRYAVYRGTIVGTKITGTASNVTGKQWTWSAELAPQP
jgi:hypothetical protein